jgi:hypothetical protein
VRDLAIDAGGLHEAFVSEPGGAGAFEVAVLRWDPEWIEIVGVEVAGLYKGAADLLVDRPGPVSLVPLFGLEVACLLNRSDVAASATCSSALSASERFVAIARPTEQFLT